MNHCKTLLGQSFITRFFTLTPVHRTKPHRKGTACVVFRVKHSINVFNRPNHFSNPATCVVLQFVSCFVSAKKPTFLQSSINNTSKCLCVVIVLKMIHNVLSTDVGVCDLPVLVEAFCEWFIMVSFSKADDFQGLRHCCLMCVLLGNAFEEKPKKDFNFL